MYKIGFSSKYLNRRTEIQEQVVEKRVASGVSGLGVYLCAAEEEVRHTRTRRNRLRQSWPRLSIYIKPGTEEKNRGNVSDGGQGSFQQGE